MTLIEIFRELIESSDAVAVRDINTRIFNNLEDFIFVFLLLVFQNIFENTVLMCQHFQDSNPCYI